LPELFWDTISSDTLLDCRVFSVERHRRRNHHREGEFFVLSGSDWCNIVPITADGQVVMVEQFRHGTCDVTLEIPGGIVDPEDRNPMEAARREMLEESGYDGGSIEALGFVHPNPAIQSNLCHSFVAFDAYSAAAPCPDDFEELRIRLIPLQTIPALILDGSITHALVVSAFAKLFFLHPRLASPAMFHNRDTA
jgi:ADP-ribose pyrophosphatase